MHINNYAAHVIKSLEWAEKTIVHQTAEEEKETFNMRFLKGLLEEAVHFSLPHDGVVLDDGLKGLEGEEIHFPFPIITMSFKYDFVNEKDIKMLVLALDGEELSEVNPPPKKDEGDYFVFFIFYCIQGKSEGWVVCPISFSIEKSKIQEFLKEGFTAYSKVVTPHTFNVYSKKYERLREAGQHLEKNEDYNGLLCDQFSGFCIAAFELCEALACTNIDSEIGQEASPSNKKRVRKGKLPILETRVLTIKVPENKGGKKETFETIGERNSPRQHLRRGHIRRVKSSEGERKNVWVRSCVVGSKGKITKDYEIRR